MLRTSKIILINGKKRSGKDHTALLIKERLTELNKTVEIMSFADIMKDILAVSFGISREDLESFKNTEEKIFTYKDSQQFFLTNFRSFLQNFGTEAMQKYFGAGVWANMLKKKIDETDIDYVVVSDFRFQHENIFEASTIKIVNNFVNNFSDFHKSENDLIGFNFDYTVDNTGHPDLKDVVSKIVCDIEIRHSF